MQMQNDFISNLQPQLAADPNVHAAWLTGSFGRGVADRYSDIDLHLLLSDVDAFRAGPRASLKALRPIVLYKLLFDGQVTNSLTAAGLRIDIWLRADPPTLNPAAVKVLFDRDGALLFARHNSRSCPG